MIRFLRWWTGGHIQTRYGRPMRLLGRIFYALGMIRVYRDGDSVPH